MKREQHAMSDRFEDGYLWGAVRFVATGQPGYLYLRLTKTGYVSLCTSIRL